MGGGGNLKFGFSDITQYQLQALVQILREKKCQAKIGLNLLDGPVWKLKQSNNLPYQPTDSYNLKCVLILVNATLKQSWMQYWIGVTDLAEEPKIWKTATILQDAIQTPPLV